MKFSKTPLFIAALFVAYPILVIAQEPSNFREFAGLLVRIVKYGAILLFVSLGVGLAYGVMIYLVRADDPRMRENMRNYLFWAVIGITVVFGLWGILAIFSETLGWGIPGIPFIS